MHPFAPMSTQPSLTSSLSSSSQELNTAAAFRKLYINPKNLNGVVIPPSTLRNVLTVKGGEPLSDHDVDMFLKAVREGCPHDDAGNIPNQALIELLLDAATLKAAVVAEEAEDSNKTTS